jgi:hypothetical protein
MVVCRFRPLEGVRSWVDSATTIIYSCFVHNCFLSCTVSTLSTLFLLPKLAERRFRPLRGLFEPEVTSPFDSLTLIWFKLAAELFGFLLPFKNYSTFRFACKMLFENFGKGILPPENNFFFNETPKRPFLESIRVVWGIALTNRLGDLVCRTSQEKRGKIR